MMLLLAVIVPAIAPLSRNSGVEFPFHWLIILMILAWLYLFVGRVVPARLRDAGWNPLLALLCLVPFVGFVMLVLLFIVPSKNERPNPVGDVSSLRYSLQNKLPDFKLVFRGPHEISGCNVDKSRSKRDRHQNQRFVCRHLRGISKSMS
jgi:hypothetical protein